VLPSVLIYAMIRLILVDYEWAFGKVLMLLIFLVLGQLVIVFDFLILFTRFIYYPQHWKHLGTMEDSRPDPGYESYLDP
jgi:hypothetical protein